MAHEPARVFRVSAGPAEVLDVATKFDVRLMNDATVVTVVEGRVAVRPSSRRANGSADRLIAHHLLRAAKHGIPSALYLLGVVSEQPQARPDDRFAGQLAILLGHIAAGPQAAPGGNHHGGNA